VGVVKRVRLRKEVLRVQSGQFFSPWRAEQALLGANIQGNENLRKNSTRINLSQQEKKLGGGE